MVSRRAALVVLALMVVACGGGSPTSPSGSSDGSSGGAAGGSSGGSGGGQGTVTALIDGVPYTGAVNLARTANGTLNIASNSADRTRAIAFAGPASVGTATVAQGRLSMTVQFTDGAAVTGVWSVGGQLGSGTLTVTSLTSAGVSGTFSFTAPVALGAPAGTTGTRTITNGAFSATF